MAIILVLAAGLCASMGAQAAIPAAERQVLLDLYTSTNGDAWTHNSGWNGAPGTECTWAHIICDPDSAHVTWILLYQNNLTGSLPSLAGLENLSHFGVYDNQLTGPIPSLTGLSNLFYFDVHSNQLTGPIPPLADLSNLSNFNVTGNQLTGPIPSLAGLANLEQFGVGVNQLTGPIPSLAGLANLSYFAVDDNHLTGSIPSLAGLENLHYFRVNDNQLRGPVPSVPSPSNLYPGGSSLCSNYLDPVPDADWDAATGETPWYQNCRPADTIFADGFGP